VHAGEGLDEGRTYEVTLSRDLEDDTRTRLGADYLFSFTTLDRRSTAIVPVFCNYVSKYLPAGAVLTFTTPLHGVAIETGTSASADADGPDAWTAGSTVTAAAVGALRVFARAVDGESPVGGVFSFTYNVVDSFPGTNAAGSIIGSEHIARTSPAIAAWPVACAEFVRGLDRSSASPAFDDPARALKGASGPVNLGNTGSITLVFDPPASDGPGADLAFFENGFTTSGGLTAEYGFLEVSSNGFDFVRFDAATLRDPASVPDPTGVMTGWNTTLDWGIMGRYPSGAGDLFDLAWLAGKRAVVEGRVDLSRISHVRLVDIIGIDEARLAGPDDSQFPRADHRALISSLLGTYDSSDCFGNVIFDQYPTVGTGGLDLDAVAWVLAP
jgi:hypothetical protein